MAFRRAVVCGAVCRLRLVAPAPTADSLWQLLSQGAIERTWSPACGGFDRIGFVAFVDRYSDWFVDGSLGLVRADQHRRLSTAAHDFAAVMDAGGGDVLALATRDLFS